MQDLAPQFWEGIVDLKRINVVAHFAPPNFELLCHSQRLVKDREGWGRHRYASTVDGQKSFNRSRLFFRGFSGGKVVRRWIRDAFGTINFSTSWHKENPQQAGLHFFYHTKWLSLSTNWHFHSFVHSFIPFHSIPFHSIPFHSIPFHSISFHFISFHFISFHFIHSFIHSFILSGQWVLVPTIKTLLLQLHKFRFFLGSIRLVGLSKSHMPHALLAQPQIWQDWYHTFLDAKISKQLCLGT